MTSIAVLDQDQVTRELVCNVLADREHRCVQFATAGELLTYLSSHTRRDELDLLILSWQVAELTGAQIVQAVRDKTSPSLPILFIVALPNEYDIDAGLAAGANDYLIKPVRRGELAARTQALLRISYPSETDHVPLQFGVYQFEPVTGLAQVNGAVVTLTQKEFKLALLLFRHIGQPLSRAYILDTVWSRDVDVPSRTIDTHISRVRNKLALHPENGVRLSPVYSYGYQLETVTLGD